MISVSLFNRDDKSLKKNVKSGRRGKAENINKHLKLWRIFSFKISRS